MWMRVLDGHFAGEWVQVPEPFVTVIIPEFRGDSAMMLGMIEHRYTPQRYIHPSWRCQECGKLWALWMLARNRNASLLSPWQPDGAAVSLEIGEELDALQKHRLAEQHMARYASRWWMEITGWVVRDA